MIYHIKNADIFPVFPVQVPELLKSSCLGGAGTRFSEPSASMACNKASSLESTGNVMRWKTSLTSESLTKRDPKISKPTQNTLDVDDFEKMRLEPNMPAIRVVVAKGPYSSLGQSKMTPSL